MAAPKIWHFNGSVLAERYWQPGMSTRKIATMYGCSRYTIEKALIEFGVARRPAGGAHLEGRWSRLWDRCIVCKSTERPHAGHGMCDRCMSLRKWREANPGRPQYVKRDYSEVACR